MPTISLCMIVKNEEQFLEQCLNSIKDLVNEIIIVDTGSTDKTKEIASKFKAKIYDFQWCDDFSAARNESLKHATGDWIMVLDADETIAERDLSKIRELVMNTEAKGYILTQRNYIHSLEDLNFARLDGIEVRGAGQAEKDFISSLGDDYIESKDTAGWFSVPIVRLFRNSSDLAFSGRIHEDISPSMSGKIVHSDIPIHHFGKMNIENWKKKWVLYEQLEEKKAAEEKDYYAYFELGRQYLANQKIEPAKEMLLRSIKLNNNFWTSWFNLGSIYLIQGQREEAIICLEKAKTLNPSVAIIYTNLGVAYVQEKESKKAIDNFLIAVELNPRDADAYFNLGLCYNEMGEKNQAYRAFEKAIELNPEYQKSVHLG